MRAVNFAYRHDEVTQFVCFAVALAKMLLRILFALTAAAVVGPFCVHVSDAALAPEGFIERVGLAAGRIAFIEVATEQADTFTSVDECAIVLFTEVRGVEVGDRA
jgi:hypothetical protein